MINIITVNNIDFKINEGEVLRYMGAPQSKDGRLLSLVEEEIDRVCKTCRPTACYMRSNVICDGDMLDFSFAKIKSDALKKNLADCSEVFIFAATLGSDFDRLVARALISSPTQALILDAVGSSAIEGVCDSLCNTLEGLTNGKLKTRFSPGYGDLNIGFQNRITEVLETKRKIGLSLTDGLMLTPTKSVTAIVGIPN